MKISFNTLTPNAKSFPRPRLPVQPVLKLTSFTLFSDKKKPDTAFATHADLFFRNARTCLVHAFKWSGLNSNSAVLIPAYHCGSMVEPAMWWNAEVLLYHMRKDLSPNRSHIEQLVLNATKPIKAMLLPHYFGFPQDLSFWREFCDTHKIKLIEDCAHAFFGATASNETLGAVGDYAITSTRKFFSSPDGGVLISKIPQQGIMPFVKPSLKPQLIAVIQALISSAEFGKLGLLGRIMLNLDTQRAKLKSSSQNQANTNASQQQKSWQWIEPELMNVAGLPISKLIMKQSNFPLIAKIRRRNYIRLIEGMSDLPEIEPLYPELPANVVPYMMPLILNNHEEYFNRLKQAAIPIWRWEELAESDCSTSQTYRLKLLQIPCHQDLTLSDIDWIIEKLRNVIIRKKQ